MGVLYTNCDCLTTNRKEALYSLIATDDLDIIALSEILPKTSTLPVVEEYMYYNIENYDRVISNIDKGRGVVLYIKVIYTHKAAFEVSVWCSVKLNTNNTLLVGYIHRSPNSSETNNIDLFNILK